MPGYASPQVGYYNPALAEGKSLSQNSLILGIISIVAGVAGFTTFLTGLAGLVLGTLALSKAVKAKKLGLPFNGRSARRQYRACSEHRIYSVLDWIGSLYPSPVLCLFDVW